MTFFVDSLTVRTQIERECIMNERVSFCDFTDRFRSHDRQDQFTYDGKRALFDYLEEYEESCGEEIELDVIALCCEFTEYESATECATAVYDFQLDSDLDEDEKDEACMEYLTDHTQVILFDSGIIIQDF